MLKFLRLISPSSLLVRRSSNVLSCCKERSRSFADTTTPPSSSKQIVVQGNENEHRVRVRRARPADAPRLLRFVRENPRSVWPSFLPSGPPAAPSAAANIMLTDYVARILAQGHSMVAEQVGSRRGWLAVRGVALGAAVCSWDASMLERWAACLRCPRTKRLLHFSAHCLRAPRLHDKYDVHNILQVILVLPPETTSNVEIVQMLAKGAIQRGKEVGFPLLRFDVSDEAVAKALEDLNLKKEWHMSYDVLPEAMTESAGSSNPPPPPAPATGDGVGAGAAGTGGEQTGNFLTVYTALTSTAAEAAPPTPKTDPTPPTPSDPPSKAPPEKPK